MAASFRTGSALRVLNVDENTIYFGGEGRAVINEAYSLHLTSYTIISVVINDGTKTWGCYFNKGVHGIWLGSSSRGDDIYSLIGDTSKWRVIFKSYVTEPKVKYFFADVWDSSTHRNDVYVNGTKLEYTYTGDDFSIGDLSVIAIGRQVCCGNGLIGKIYLTIFYKEPKDENFILSLYNDWKNGKDISKYIDDSCVIYFDNKSFDDIEMKWYDKGPNKWNAQLEGTTFLGVFRPLRVVDKLR